MDYLKLLNSIADKTDQMALEYFRKVDLHVEYKKDKSPVSEGDKKIEDFVRQFLRKKAPELSVFGEEYGEDKNQGIRLIIDPIDGTRNFIKGVPIFATLLAIEDEGKIVAGLASAPALFTRWQASQKDPAQVINKKLHLKKNIKVSTTKDLAKSQAFHASLSGNEIRDDFKPRLTNLLNGTLRQRGFGDFYQHVLVAQGSGDLAIDPSVKPWDIAALKIIIEQAGGKMTAISGIDSIYEGSAITSNNILHPDILKKLNSKV